MVAAVENRTMITGVVTGRRAHPSTDRWDLITVEVHETAPVPGSADLLTRRIADQNGTIELAVDRSELVGTGGRIEVQATLAGPDVIRAVGPVRST